MGYYSPLLGTERHPRTTPVAEGEGFEPPDPSGPVVFKTTALSRSATPPVRDCAAGQAACRLLRLRKGVQHRLGLGGGGALRLHLDRHFELFGSGGEVTHV